MSGIKRTQALYDAVAHQLRLNGPKVSAPRGVPKWSAAAKACGVGPETVRRMWEYGWPDKPGFIPIKDLIGREQLFARAARDGFGSGEPAAIAAQEVIQDSLSVAEKATKSAEAMLVRAAREAEAAEKRARELMAEAEMRLNAVEELSKKKLADAEDIARATLGNAELQARTRLADLLRRAKVDAAETMADEAQAAKFGRKAALGAAAIAALVLKDAQLIASQLRTSLGDLSKLTPMQAMRIAREMIRLVESAEKALILALQAERLRVGQPTEVLGITTVEGGLEEKEIKLRAVARHLAEKRERIAASGLRAVVGGAPQAVGVPTVAAPAQEGK